MEDTSEYKIAKPVQKEIDVKRIFFIEGQLLPCFEMITGEIRRAYFMQSPQGIKTLWYTDAEFEAFKKQLDEKNLKSKTALKIVDKNGNKINRGN